MRWLLLLGIIALAAVARAEEEALWDEEVVALHEEEEGIDLLETADENSRFDVARMLKELFEFDDTDDEEHDEELGVERESRAMNDDSALEMKAVVEPEDQARYNKFMDTFFRRLNADARSTIDPLEVGIVSKKKKRTGKNSPKKSSTKKGNKDGERKGKRKGPKGKDKKGSGKKPKNKKNKQNKNKNKKKGRHPKSLIFVEGVEEDDDGEEAAIAEEGPHVIVARDTEHVEEIDEDDDDEEALERQERSLDVGVDDDDEESLDSTIAISRSGKPKSNKKSKGKKKKQGGKRKGGNGKKGNKNNKKKNKRSANKNKNKGNKGPKTSRASVSGIATLTRMGDVSVVNRKDGKELRTDFKMGPVNLRVNRRFGSGKNAIVKTAMAESPELTGKMYLAVAKNGRAKITRFNIVRPAVVTTSGSLNKDGARLDNNNFMENSISRIVPMAAKKLKITARDVLRATESKN